MLAEWFTGEDAAGEHYLVHTTFPRFIARLANEDFPASGITQLEMSSGETLCDIMWIDECRQDIPYLLALIESASRALDEMDDIAIEELERYDADREWRDA